MRTLPRILGGALAAALVLLIAPVPAAAGGPTSVLLVSPTRGVAAALYYDDAEYGRLLGLLGESWAAEPDAPDLSGGPGTDALNVTWMVHDVMIWRVDRVFLDADGGPWVETRTLPDGDGSVFDKPGVVHHPTGGKELVALLTTMRLVGPDAASNQGIRPVAAPAALAANAAPADREPAGVDWVWALAGLAAGVLLTVGLRPLVRRRASN